MSRRIRRLGNGEHKEKNINLGQIQVLKCCDYELHFDLKESHR